MEPLDVRFVLSELHCKKTEDSGGDEPYLWMLGFKVDAETLGPPGPDSHPLLPSLGVRVIEGPTHRSHPHFVAGDRSVEAPATLPIPPAMGTRELRLEPANIPVAGWFPGIAGIVCVLWDNDAFTRDTRNRTYEAFRDEFGPALSDELNKLANGGYDHLLRHDPNEGLAIPQRLERLGDAAARTRAVEAMKNAIIPRVTRKIRDVVGISVDPDDPLGAEVQVYLGSELAGVRDISLRYTDDEADYTVRGQAFGQAVRVAPPAPRVVIYGIQENGDLLWYRHEGAADGTFTWAEGSGTKVGNGWDFARVFSGGGGIVYAIEKMTLDPVTGRRGGGDLLWYRHDGWQSGGPQWTGPRKVGNGWGDFTHVFHAGEGVIYAVRENGDLLWYRHVGRTDGTFDWAPESGKKVGNGWSFQRVFAGGDGIIYAIQDRRLDPVTGRQVGGTLLWYRHGGWRDGGDGWSGPVTAGTRWEGFRQVVHGAGGILYAAQKTSLDPVTGRWTGGRLLWYRHDGRNDGAHHWAADSGKVVGRGWRFAEIFAA